MLGRVPLARSIDPRCTQPDWDAAVEQFSLLFFLRLLSDKRGAEISQNLHQIVELISRIEGLLQSRSSTPLQVTYASVCAGIFQIFVVEAKVVPSLPFLKDRTGFVTISTKSLQSRLPDNHLTQLHRSRAKTTLNWIDR